MEDKPGILGEEKRLVDILSDEEVLPLLEAAVDAGACHAAISDEYGTTLWSQGVGTAQNHRSCSLPIRLEGEQVGFVSLAAEREPPTPPIETLATILWHAITTILLCKLKRLLTNQVHATVVNLSYEELMTKNNLLALSEKKYRDLSESLEKTVEERTRELNEAHLQLLQQEKMTAIGQLAAGIAHEINNPLGYIISNLTTLKSYAEKFILLAERYRHDNGLQDDAHESGIVFWKEMKFDHVCNDVLPLITESIEGAVRVKNIVADLKGFAHSDEGSKAAVNLNEEIERTLRVLAHDIPRDAVITKDYGDIPPFICNPGLFCQVFLNILRNAFQARVTGLALQIRTEQSSKGTVLTFSDNGPGIPKDVSSRIFDPFFSTREIGKGMGLGLTVAYDIVKGAGGTIKVTCPETGGTTFSILLPQARNS